MLKDGGKGGHQNSWRIANYQDIVTSVPPGLLPIEFQHINSGTRIFADKAPEDIPSEIGKGIPKHLNGKVSQHRMSTFSLLEAI